MLITNLLYSAYIALCSLFIRNTPGYWASKGVPELDTEIEYPYHMLGCPNFVRYTSGPSFPNLGELIRFELECSYSNDTGVWLGVHYTDPNATDLSNCFVVSPQFAASLEEGMEAFNEKLETIDVDWMAEEKSSVMLEDLGVTDEDVIEYYRIYTTLDTSQSAERTESLEK